MTETKDGFDKMMEDVDNYLASSENPFEVNEVSSDGKMRATSADGETRVFQLYVLENSYTRDLSVRVLEVK